MTVTFNRGLNKNSVHMNQYAESQGRQSSSKVRVKISKDGNTVSLTSILHQGHFILY